MKPYAIVENATALEVGIPLLPGSGDRVEFASAEFWNHTLAATYAAEMRTESPETIRSVYAAAPERFDRIRRRLLGEETAESLTDHAKRELVSGRPVSAEMSWRRVVEEHPQSPHAGPSLVHLGGSLLEAGERTQAAEELARLPELDLESAMSAAPLMSRLLAEVEADLEREGPVSGKDRIKLHDSVEDPGLDRARELSEWISGWALVDEIARTLRLETSGDLLR